ncbi:MAG: hypothetical protein CMH55_05620 [Myxococcales bacterium]|nr:hypothetical protein [Myxococcales bacterium]
MESFEDRVDFGAGSKPVVGVSSCLLGKNVRYNGGHTMDKFVAHDLSQHFEYILVCPEMAIGLGTPRPTLRLVESVDSDSIRLQTATGDSDVTDRMVAFATQWAEAEGERLRGFVAMRKSPSCGVHRVKVYSERSGMPQTKGEGLFIRALRQAQPLLPMDEGGRLNDPALRENFLTRVFAYTRLKDLFAAPWTQGDLVRFHSREKMLLLAHDNQGYRRLGRFVANAASEHRTTVEAVYCQGFMECLQQPSNPGRHTNVLQHLAGFLRPKLPSQERQELADLIHGYREGKVPRLAPLTLLNHHLRRLKVHYVLGQSYLRPHPSGLDRFHHF